MSCEKCEEAQDGTSSAFFRWKNANVELRGCDEHLKEVMDVLRDSSRHSQKEQAHKATEYPEGICICPHRYTDGGCHVRCPQCNPDNLPCPAIHPAPKPEPLDKVDKGNNKKDWRIRNENRGNL